MYLLIPVFFGITYITIIIFIYLDRNNYIQGNDFFGKSTAKRTVASSQTLRAGISGPRATFPPRLRFLPRSRGSLSYRSFSVFWPVVCSAVRGTLLLFRVLSNLAQSADEMLCGFAAIELGTAIFILLKIHVDGKTFPFPENYFQSSATFLSTPSLWQQSIIYTGILRR